MLRTQIAMMRYGRSLALLGAALGAAALAVSGWHMLHRNADGARPLDLLDLMVDVPSQNSRGIALHLPHDGKLELNVNVIKGTYVNAYVASAASWTQFTHAHTGLFAGRYQNYLALQTTRSMHSRTTGVLSGGEYFIVVENPTLGVRTHSSFDVEVQARLDP